MSQSNAAPPSASPTLLPDLLAFLRQAAFAVGIGLLVGAVGVAFHYGIDLATHLRQLHPWLICLLPLGGLAIVLLYQVCGMEKDQGTNLVLVAVREHEPMRLRTAPLIFLSTILTHLVGGSAGREGAALQLGASISSKIAHVLGFPPERGRILTVCGMSAAFSALFGTPLTAAVFALEVVHVGVMQYSALVPAVLSSLTGALLAGWLGVTPTAYAVSGIPALSPLSLAQMVVLGGLCAGLSVLFCKVVHGAGHLYAKALPDPRLRAVVGGLLMLGLSFLDGGLADQVYNGAGGNLVEAAVTGGGAGVMPWAFLVKLLFTALTLGAGFRGGEIVPTFACGATFGCTVAPLLGLSPSFGGAVGVAAAFCGVTNCPLSSLLLAVELFGGGGLPLFALAVAVSYRLSGYTGLYSEQQIVYAKHIPQQIEKKAE
ncbi:MAG TPA: chloride channel protein [Candidatus Intestinimonas pullistercoris]|uniref:Chloride channel protein n=1 Tax=Candidatus Intestinimonas pullistercoris TaxID=2838623 RepID=A0A9D2NZS1_9FIRM|nr:chloride channel protein [Candidatus Intestinimonas pullistercoris]